MSKFDKIKLKNGITIFHCEPPHKKHSQNKIAFVVQAGNILDTALSLPFITQFVANVNWEISEVFENSNDGQSPKSLCQDFAIDGQYDVLLDRTIYKFEYTKDNIDLNMQINEYEKNQIQLNELQEQTCFEIITMLLANIFFYDPAKKSNYKKIAPLASQKILLDYAKEPKSYELSCPNYYRNFSGLFKYDYGFAHCYKNPDDNLKKIFYSSEEYRLFKYNHYRTDNLIIIMEGIFNEELVAKFIELLKLVPKNESPYYDYYSQMMSANTKELLGDIEKFGSYRVLHYEAIKHGAPQMIFSFPIEFSEANAMRKTIKLIAYIFSSRIHHSLVTKMNIHLEYQIKMQKNLFSALNLIISTKTSSIMDVYLAIIDLIKNINSDDITGVDTIDSHLALTHAKKHMKNKLMKYYQFDNIARNSKIFSKGFQLNYENELKIIDRITPQSIKLMAKKIFDLKTMIFIPPEIEHRYTLLFDKHFV
jgi:hypothetical protein